MILQFNKTIHSSLCHSYWQIRWFHSLTRGLTAQNTGDTLMLSMLGKNFSRQHFEMFCKVFPENRNCLFMHELLKRLWHFMQIVSRRQFAWNVKACFLEKIRKISVCCLLNLPRVKVKQKQLFLPYKNNKVRDQAALLFWLTWDSLF